MTSSWAPHPGPQVSTVTAYARRSWCIWFQESSAKVWNDSVQLMLATKPFTLQLTVAQSIPNDITLLLQPTIPFDKNATPIMNWRSEISCLLHSCDVHTVLATLFSSNWPLFVWLVGSSIIMSLRYIQRVSINEFSSFKTTKQCSCSVLDSSNCFTLGAWNQVHQHSIPAQIAKFMGPTWGPSGSCRQNATNHFKIQLYHVCVSYIYIYI